MVGFALEGGMPATAVDLGTGSGIMAFLLAKAGVVTSGVDVQPQWAPYWETSLAQSRFQPVLSLGNVAQLRGRWDLAVSNPPYFPAGSGPSAPDEFKAAARTESVATLADFLAAGLRVADRLCVVLPVERDEEAAPENAYRSRHVRVGRRRSLVEWRVGTGDMAPIETVSETDERVARWYGLARGEAGK